MEFNIRKFPMHKMPKNSIIVTIGKRNTGKSFLIKDILYHVRDIPLGSVISHTDKLTNYYSKFIPGMFIYDRYESKIIEKIFKRQQRALAENWKDPHIFLLLDDCLADKTWVRDEALKEVFFNGRHYQILFLLSMQSPMGLTPNLRSNIDYTFILKTNISSDRKKIYEHYAGIFSSREIFELVFNECTEDYHCLVIDNVTQSNNLEDVVFIYKAESHDDFKMCSNAMWRVNNERYNDKQRFDAPKHGIKTKEITMKKGAKMTIKRPV